MGCHSIVLCITKGILELSVCVCVCVCPVIEWAAKWDDVAGLACVCLWDTWGAVKWQERLPGTIKRRTQACVQVSGCVVRSKHPEQGFVTLHVDVYIDFLVLFQNHPVVSLQSPNKASALLPQLKFVDFMTARIFLLPRRGIRISFIVWRRSKTH